MVDHAGTSKWYESSFASAALGVAALIFLVVFLTLIFGKNPATFVKVLGAVATLTGAVAALIWGTRRGRRQVAVRVKPVLDRTAEELRDGILVEQPVEHPPPPAQAQQIPKMKIAGVHGRWQSGTPVPPAASAAGPRPLQEEVGEAADYLRKLVS